MKNTVTVFCGLLFLASCATNPTPIPVRPVRPPPPLPWGTNVQHRVSRPAAAAVAPTKRRNPLQVIGSLIPPPPDSNHWIVITLPNVSSSYTVYQQTNLGGTWLIATNASTNVIRLPINPAVKCCFYKATASPLSQSVTLAWNPSTDPTVVGYNIYYGGASGIYTNVLNAGNVIGLTVGGLLPGCMFYFAATTYNSSGVQSPFSNEVSYRTTTNSPILLSAAATLSPTPPVVVSVAATNVTATNAVVGGKVISTGGDSPVTMFFYGTTDPLTNTNAAWQFIAITGISTNMVSTTLTNLMPNTAYYYVFVALNAAGMVESSPEMSFVTRASLIKTGKPNPFFIAAPPVRLRVVGLP